ncbi:MULTISPECIES: ABC transporter permease [Streptomycetaceae]|uniref:Sugar ABC transporter integral membrane protein n=1 Tax=Streptantibioticus cattleyicolor (strain ATCC 35852 / DSM 46488 / JCM 4925 / NBRC 14057 / NRRL 8057) TaxID=1003195 RepID=F8K171_STREN|nr:MULTISPECIES: ABC transporter permease [Streptomycetaceae]AEW96143.1 sugar ABC transporter integral membrane protein [Streptantibioticus cattleyicolor NRRL 8057 = DSM 46488]MYS60669.1 ABC transporter permease [Streptomyces sp. SID5468]CCB76480.1 Sugar ABC transporter integral membrane protein [Streptantibioticus cattleyicolor NRRL 8057 = DSM 46488]
MSATATTTTAPKSAQGRAKRTRLTTPVILLIVAGALLALSAVRALTGAQDVTSSGQVAGALQMAVPIGMAGLAGLWSERAGVVNIGLEGMMILGTFFGAWIGWQYGPWAGLVAGVIGGAAGGLLHAVATVTFGVDHIVSGVAITLLAQGATQYLAKLWFNTGAAAAKGGNPKQSPPVHAVPSITVPGLSSGLEAIEKHHWFLVSDLAGLIGGLVTGLSWWTVIAALLFVATFFVLWRTPFGLRLRSCGEAPVAAESLGVDVYRYKYAAVVLSGALAGFGGAFLAMVPSHIYNEGQTGGRGYIGLAAMIFGNWRPGGLAMGAGLFGYTDSLQLRNGGPAAHALLLLLVILLALLAGWKVYRKSYPQGVLSAVAAALLLFWFLMTDTIPDEFVSATPYVTTLLVLALSAQRLRMPKMGGKPYRKGQGK